ncbi:unnamed protein product [Effrenium voratum]|uniref:Uncharacterized protein n=1 Tax=Effrenium voratum TaxID=2562239 RepID=A0AA36N1L4_9DINO|nr:unnamed protein product [Effrenium voratum]
MAKRIESPKRLDGLERPQRPEGLASDAETLAELLERNSEIQKVDAADAQIQHAASREDVPVEPKAADAGKREKHKKKEKKEKREKKDKKQRDKKDKKEGKEAKEKRDRRHEPKQREADVGGNLEPEPGSLDAKALEMKLWRREAKEMRRQQRALKREERQFMRAEMEELAQEAEGLEAIDQLIEEQLVKELNELERLRKQAKTKRVLPATASVEGVEVEGAEGAVDGADAEGTESTLPMPNDPMNPLNAAYDMRAYELLRKLRLDEEHQISQIALDEPEWDHLGYLRRSPSPCRLRTKGAMWPTRKGAWRSRAGGVYLPPENAEERPGSRSPSPAKWMYPEEFNRPVQSHGWVFCTWGFG